MCHSKGNPGEPERCIVGEAISVTIAPTLSLAAKFTRIMNSRHYLPDASKRYACSKINIALALRSLNNHIYGCACLEVESLFYSTVRIMNSFCARAMP